MRCGGERCEPGSGRARGVVAARQAACTGMARVKAWGPRARAERTSNMRLMVVTLEVSQPEMSALKFVKPRKRERMSVMAETHQSAMGPYFAMAEAAFELNCVTAVFRESLVVKVGGDDDGGGGDGGGSGESDGGEGDGCDGDLADA